MTVRLSELKQRATDPHSWLEHAESLFLAAEELAKALFSTCALNAPSENRVLMLGLARGSMTLLGAGLECVLKAIAVSRGLLSETASGIAFSAALHGRDKHDLVAMAESLSLRLKSVEIDLLKRSTEYLRWAGRYPTALRLGRSAAAARQRALNLKPNDLAVARGMALRARTECGSAT